MRQAPLFALVGAGLALVALQAFGPRPKPAPVAAHKPSPVAAAPTPGPDAELGDASEPAPKGGEAPLPVDELEDAQAKEIDAGMAYIDAIRKIPGAAPLLDDIVAYLKHDNGENFSVEGLPTDANGLAVVDATANKKMIKDPTIRAKWEALMKLVADHAGK